MHDELIKELEAIGLSEKEARVYLTVLEVGQATVQEIGKKADVNRATTYVILDSLMTKGLIATFGEGKKGLYIAEAPHGLNNIIREQEEELEKRDAQLDILMPELHSLYNLHPNKPEVRFYEGKEGLKEMQKAFQDSGVESAEMIFTVSDVLNIFTEEELREARAQRTQKNIKASKIYTDVTQITGERNKFIVKQDGFTNSIKIPADQYPITCDITIYGEEVMIAALLGNISGLIIKNKSITDTLRAVFRLAYEGAIELGDE